MILNENSFSAKLYKWFYGKTELPISLCPYGRKLILAYLTLIPLSILGLPCIISEYFEKNYEIGESKMSDRVGLSCILYFFILLLICMGSSIFWLLDDYPKDTFVYSVGPIGVFLWVAVLSCFIFWGVKTTHRYVYSIIPENNNVIIEYIKAKKNKICPKITWVKK